MTQQSVAVYGSGGFAREVAWLAEQCGHRVVCFVDDDTSKTGRLLNEIPVLTIEDAAKRFPNAGVSVGIGSPSAREKVNQRAEGSGLQPLTLVHPRVERSQWMTFGKGVVICAGNILTTNITVGDHVQVNLDCTIGHDVILEDFATLAPGVHVSGYVHIRRSAYIGTGATIINGVDSRPITIGEGAIVGAGACVTRSVDPGTTVVGVPAKAIVPKWPS